VADQGANNKNFLSDNDVLDAKSKVVYIVYGQKQQKKQPTAKEYVEIFLRNFQPPSGNFQPPEVRPIPDSPNLQVCLVFITCHFGKTLKSTEEFYTHFTS
jgi:hypothetical protein